MGWLALIAKIPLVVSGIAAIIGKVKSAPTADKVQATVSAVLTSPALTALGVDVSALQTDPKLQTLLNDLVTAEHAVLAARDALTAELTALSK